MDRFRVITAAGPVRVTLYRREPGGVVYCYARVNKRRVRTATGARNDRDARDAAERIVCGLAAETKPTGLSWEGVARAYLDALHTSDLDKRTEEHRLGAFLKATRGPVPPTFELAREEIGRWLSSLHLSPVSLRNYRVAINRLCAWLIRERRVAWTQNPAGAAFHTRQRTVTKVRPIPTADDIRRLLDATDGMEIHAVIALVLSGVRPGSAATVKWTDLDGGRLRVREKNVERIIPLAPWVKKALDARRQAAARVPGALEGPIYPPGQSYAAQREIATLRRMLGLPAWLGLQALRRATDQRLYQKGAPAGLAAQVMGHSPTTAEKHYLDWRKLDAGAAVKALDWLGDTSGDRLRTKRAYLSLRQSTSHRGEKHK